MMENVKLEFIVPASLKSPTETTYTPEKMVQTN